MIFEWFADRRRRKILETPFPDDWVGILERRFAYWKMLDDDERKQLRDLVQVFVAEKTWEGAGGLEIDDDVRVTIAAQACLLVLGLPHDMYRQVDSIIVYPSTVIAPPPKAGFFSGAPQLHTGGMPILGQAFSRGPVILVWDAVRKGAADARDGHNVVFHELAHKLDMLSDGADGIPPLPDAATYARWVDVFTREYELLKRQAAAGRRTYLDTYALTNGPEFFAVATEHFFEQPEQMAKGHAAMYELLRDFYRQDPAARVRRSKSARRDR
jgi:hypothetical protein